MATSTSRHLAVSRAAASAFSSARNSRTLGATLICAIAAAGLPARNSAMTLSGQGEGRANAVFHRFRGGRIVRRRDASPGQAHTQQLLSPQPTKGWLL